MSAATSALKAGVVAAPEEGPAKTTPDVWVAKVITKVPELVTGDPATEKIEGAERPTEVTVPELPLVCAQVPSPRQKVPEFALVPLLKSLTVKALHKGTPEEPLGLAKNRFWFSAIGEKVR